MTYAAAALVQDIEYKVGFSISRMGAFKKWIEGGFMKVWGEY